MLVAVLATAAGCHGASENKAGGRVTKPLVLTLANGDPDDIDVGEWVQAVQRLSGGAIRIDIRSNWRQGQGAAVRATISDIRRGRVDLGKVPARAWDAVGVRSFNALLAPFLVSSYRLERQIASGSLGEKMLAGVGQVGVVGLALVPGELQHPVGVTRDLVGPPSYAGARIAVRSHPAAVGLRALGGRPQLVQGPTDLSMFDGAEISLFSLDIDRYYRQTHSVTTNVVLWPRAMTIAMNKNAYERLSPGQRAILHKAAVVAIPAVMRRLRTTERGAVESACSKRVAFVSASAGDTVALRAAVRPVYGQLEHDPSTGALLRQIAALRVRGAAVERVPACLGRRAGAAAVSPLDGTWLSSATRSQFAAAHPSPGEAPDQNYGNYTLILGQGRFRLRNSRFPGDAGFGRVSLTGSVITFVPGGAAEQGAGEIWKYRWNLYRGTLVLRRFNNVGPTAFVVNPWRHAK